MTALRPLFRRSALIAGSPSRLSAVGGEYVAYLPGLGGTHSRPSKRKADASLPQRLHHAESGETGSPRNVVATAGVAPVSWNPASSVSPPAVALRRRRPLVVSDLA